MVRRRRSFGPALAIALSAATFGQAAPVATAATSGLSDGDGLHVVSTKQLDARLLTLTVSTAALPGPANIEILLPDGYAADPGRRYPVLYLLHGTSGGASDWTKMGDAEKTTAGKPLIVVMPDIALGDNGGGWCTNWFNAGARGVPEWETFHIDQLIPWVDHNLRTVASRAGRAIAGLSQGGFCSTSYAARHPDLFSTVLAYSGAPDIAYDTEAEALSTPIINATEVNLDGAPPNSMFGDRATEEINWATHDPATLAENLRGMNIYMYAGNGEQGPLDPAPVGGGTPIEAAVSQDNILFHDRLSTLAIPSYYDAYGPGTHSWPYWTRDLQQSIGPIMADFARPPAPPAAVTYTTAETPYAVFGWQVTMHRAAEEFSTLEAANAQGFALAGSGSGSVVTPPVFTANASYTVTLQGDTTSQSLTQTADHAGRLHLEVPLGPANPDQQYTPAAQAHGTQVYTTRVQIDQTGSRGAALHRAQARACASRGSVTMHLHLPRGARVQVRVNGSLTHATVRRDSVYLSLIVRPYGTYHIDVVVRSRRGQRLQTLRVTRTLHTCRPRSRRR
jgi:S-formylglutathione hydrolase FrmB